MYSFEEETHMNNPKIPQYGIVSNIQYMTGLAVRICKSVLILAVVQITLGVLMNRENTVRQAGGFIPSLFSGNYFYRDRRRLRKHERNIRAGQYPLRHCQRPA